MSVTIAYQKAVEIANRIADLQPITVRRYFGGAALVAESVQFGFVMGERFYLRVDDALRTALKALGGQPFVYRGHGKDIEVAPYYELPAAVLNDTDQLSEYVLQACRVASTARRRAKSTS